MELRICFIFHVYGPVAFNDKIGVILEMCNFFRC